MSVCIDICLLILFAVIFIRHWHAGFFKSVLSSTRLLISFLVTYIFGAEFAAWLHTTIISPIVFKDVYEILKNMSSETVSHSTRLFNQINEALDFLIDPSVLESHSSDIQTSAEDMVEYYANAVSESVSATISNILGYLLIFLATFAVLSFFIWLMCKVVNLPVIRRFDRILGMILGCIIGFLCLAFAASAIKTLLLAADLTSVYDSSFLLHILGNMNIFDFIISNLL